MAEDNAFKCLMYYFLGHNTVTPAHLPFEERYQKTTAYTKKCQSDAKWWPVLIEEAEKAGFIDEEREGEAAVADYVVPAIGSADAIKALEEMMRIAKQRTDVKVERYIEAQDTHAVYHFIVVYLLIGGGSPNSAPIASAFMESIASKQGHVSGSQYHVGYSDSFRPDTAKVTVNKLIVSSGKTVGDYVLSNEIWRKRLGVSTLTGAYARIIEMKKTAAELPGLIEKGRRHLSDNERRNEDKMPFNAKPTGKSHPWNMDVESLAVAEESFYIAMEKAVETGDTFFGDLRCKDTGEHWKYTMTIMTTEPIRHNQETGGGTYCPGLKAFMKGVYSLNDYKIGSTVVGEATEDWPRQGIHSGQIYSRLGSVTLEFTFQGIASLPFQGIASLPFQGSASLKRTVDADTFWKNYFYKASGGKESAPSVADPFPRMGWRK